MTGAELIAEERARQQAPPAESGEGYDARHDRGHAQELARAAACYAVPPDDRWQSLGGTVARGIRLTAALDLVERLWPWERRFWKPGVHRQHRDGRFITIEGVEPDPAAARALRVRELVKAGALIAAAIDSLQDT